MAHELGLLVLRAASDMQAGSARSYSVDSARHGATHSPPGRHGRRDDDERRGGGGSTHQRSHSHVSRQPCRDVTLDYSTARTSCPANEYVAHARFCSNK